MGKEIEEKRSLKPEFLPQVSLYSGINQKEAEKLMRQRRCISGKNIGKFYVELFQKIYRGVSYSDNQNLDLRLYTMADGLFNYNGYDFKIHKYFRPDLILPKESVIFGDNGFSGIERYVEVKGISGHSLSPSFAIYQISHYLRHAKENGAESIAAIFKYGDRNTTKLYVCKERDKKKMYRCEKGKCKNKCLVDRLSHETRSLVVLPQNLWSFLLCIGAYMTQNHETSKATRKTEVYRTIMGSWLTTLSDNTIDIQEKINRIENAGRRDLFGLKLEDFCLEDLKFRQFQSPENMFCKKFHLNTFTISEYKNPISTHQKFMKKFEEKQGDFLWCLGINEIWGKEEEIEEDIRAEIENNVDLPETNFDPLYYEELGVEMPGNGINDVPQKPNDNIPI
jgi:hypothetical protein